MADNQNPLGPLPQMPDFRMQQMSTDTGPAQVALQKARLDQQNQQQSFENILRTTQMASELAQSFVEQSKQRQQRDAIHAYMTFNPMVQTPENQRTKQALLGNVAGQFPQQAATDILATNFPKQPTTMEQILAQDYLKNKTANPDIIKTIQETKTPKGLQSKAVQVDGKPATVDFNPATGKYFIAGQEISGDRITPIPPPGNAIADVRQSQLKNKLTEDLGKSLNDLGYASNSPAGISSKRELFARSGLTLIEQAKNQPGGVDKRQMAELQMETARVLTGQGVMTNEMLNKLATDSARSKVANWEEWLTNNPTGTDQQKFVDRFEETLKRQLSFHQGQTQEFKTKEMSKFTTFAKQYPEEFNASLTQAGFDPEEFRKSGKLVTKVDAAHLPPEFASIAQQIGGANDPQIHALAGVLGLKKKGTK